MKHTIPDEVLRHHTAVVGKTGSGKTSTEKLIVEQVAAAGARVCVLDTQKSDWWGITSSASGKSPGLAFQILGGPRGHVPLHSSAGKVSTSGISTRAHALGLVSQKAILGWQPEEDAILVEEYQKETKIIGIVNRLAENGFSRGRVAVQMRAIALGITRDRVNYWQPEESAIALKGLQDGKTTREIIMLLKAAGYERGVTGVTKFAQKHGISRNSAEPWTEADTKTLASMYKANKSVAEIMQTLDRSRGSIAAMASNLGLKQRLPWTDDEKVKLRKANADGLKLIDVPQLLPGRTYATVARMAGQLRLDFSQARNKQVVPKAAKKAKPQKKSRKK